MRLNLILLTTAAALALGAPAYAADDTGSATQGGNDKSIGDKEKADAGAKAGASTESAPAMAPAGNDKSIGAKEKTDAGAKAGASTANPMAPAGNDQSAGAKEKTDAEH